MLDLKGGEGSWMLVLGPGSFFFFFWREERKYKRGGLEGIEGLMNGVKYE